MKNILITGGSGFIGRHLVNRFPDSLHPTHKELDLTDSDKVRDYLWATKPDHIIHCGSNDDDICLYDNLRMFYNLTKSKIPMITFCTGREVEDRSYKNGEYVLSKHIIKELAINSNSYIQIIQIWGCFGIYEKSIRFLAGNIDRVKEGLPILVMENRLFSYVYVKDLIKIIADVLDGKYDDHLIKIVAYTRSFIDYAKILKKVAHSPHNIIVEKEDFCHSYVGKNSIDFNFTPLEEAIEEYWNEMKELKV